MRLIGLSMVKNESDVIESFVRHNLRFLDALYIIDNESVDGTREILVELEREGLPLAIVDDPRFGYFQAEKMTALFRNMCDYVAPDFVFLLDADEFLVAPSRDFLEEQLSTLPAGTHGLLGWKTYLLSPTDDLAEDNPLRRMMYRRKAENPVYYKVVIAANPGDNWSLSISQGNHAVSHIHGKEASQQVLEHISIAHFPVRSPSQLTTKVIGGWLAYLAKDPDSAATGQGYQWYNLYQQLMRNSQISIQEASAISMSYAQLGAPHTSFHDEHTIYDPLPVSFDLRYQQHVVPQPLITIARTMEYIFASPKAVPFAAQAPQKARRTGHRIAKGVREAEFRRASLALDLPPFRYIADKYQPQHVLDIGCGLGGYIRMFQEWGATEVFGIEGFPPDDLLLSKESFLQHDLTQPLDLQRTYDLVICAQVAEHINEQYEEVVIETIHRHARNRILFSAAEINQPGIGHINCKPISHWLALWEKRGWVPDAFDSIAVRSLATFSWLRRNPVVLVRVEQARASRSALTLADLERLAHYPFKWYSQSPKIYTYPLSEPLPSLFRNSSPIQPAYGSSISMSRRLGSKYAPRFAKRLVRRVL